MKIQLKKTRAALMAMALIVPALGVVSKPVQADDVEIKATIKAVCSLSMDTVVDLGDILITEFNGKEAGEEISGHDKSFAITPNCAGTTKYALTFTPVKASSGCLEASSEEVAFCLYDADGEKIDLATTGTRVEKDYNASASAETITVVPARATKAPGVGVHSGTMTVTIAPL